MVRREGLSFMVRREGLSFVVRREGLSFVVRREGLSFVVKKKTKHSASDSERPYLSCRTTKGEKRI